MGSLLTTDQALSLVPRRRATPTRGWRVSSQRSIHATHEALKDLRVFVRWLGGAGDLRGAVKVRVTKLAETIVPVLSDEDVPAATRTPAASDQGHHRGEGQPRDELDPRLPAPPA